MRFLALGSLALTSLALGLVACTTQKTTATSPPQTGNEIPPRAIRLVVWLTVDQLPTRRFEERSRDPRGAFHALRSSGRYYSGARYAHSNTETAPGHATLFSGTSPSKHGIVANEWWDYGLGRTIPSTFDAASPLLEPGTDAAKTGRSPRALLEPTLGDVLLERKPLSKVYALSLKDRGAIFPAGKRGKAVWFQEGSFTSSRYYFDEAPQWLKGATPHEALTRQWTLHDPVESYASRSVPRSALAPSYLGAIFPHQATADATLEKVLRASPFGDEALLALALEVTRNEALGQDEHPDLLAISLSSNDYVSHYFGPESLEAEDLLRRTDLGIAKFLEELDHFVPQENVLVVLSSDHGGSASPEELLRHGTAAGRIDATSVKTALKRSFESAGIRRKLLDVVPPYAYLERESGAAPLTKEEVARLEEHLKRELPTLAALRSTSSLDGRDELTEAVAESVRPGVSGDLYLVFAPHHHFVQEPTMASTHGSPWDYDREVPVLLSGGSVPQGESKNRVRVDQLAPRVARELGLSWKDRESLSD